MNIISRLLQNSRFKLFAAATVTRVELLSPEDRAAALVQAVAYCLDLRRHDGGIMISMALLDPSQLSIRECKELFYNLETPYFQAESAKVSASEAAMMSSRYGKEFGSDYKKIAEANHQIYAVGLGILMSRLSYRAARLEAKINLLHEPPSAYTRMASSLREALPHIATVIQRFNALAEVATPEKIWSPETMSFANNCASNLAMLFPS
jgi:hypothetical protein